MADKKLIQLTREDFQRAKQQENLFKQWAAEMSFANEAPLCMISVNSEGQKFIRMMRGIDFKKVSAILKHIAGQIEFIQPATTKPD